MYCQFYHDIFLLGRKSSIVSSSKVKKIGKTIDSLQQKQRNRSYFSETFETSFDSLPNQALMKLNSTHLHKNTPSCLDRRIQASVDCHSGGSMRDRDGTLLNQPIHSLSWARRHVQVVASIRAAVISWPVG